MDTAVNLLWIPLGAGQRVVRTSGKLFEALTAAAHRRQRCDLYHSALVITVPEGSYTIEMAPIPDFRGERRGVVAEGPVGVKAGSFEIRLGFAPLLAPRSMSAARAAHGGPSPAR